MDFGIMALRVVHIGAAILWVGGSVFIERFVQPTADELGPAGEPFMGTMLRRGMPAYFPIVSGLTVLAGSWLYWIDSAGNPISYLTGGGSGITFGIGGIAAWIAFIVGAVAIGPNAARIARTNATIEATGRTPELEAQLVSANAAIHRAGQIGLVLLTIAIVCMAVARYA